MGNKVLCFSSFAIATAIFFVLDAHVENLSTLNRQRSTVAVRLQQIERWVRTSFCDNLLVAGMPDHYGRRATCSLQMISGAFDRDFFSCTHTD